MAWDTMWPGGEAVIPASVSASRWATSSIWGTVLLSGLGDSSSDPTRCMQVLFLLSQIRAPSALSTG